jgi:hypothetical protein
LFAADIKSDGPSAAMHPALRHRAARERLRAALTVAPRRARETVIRIEKAEIEVVRKS